MASIPGRFRRTILTPDIRQTLLKVRGFPVRNPEARQCLEVAGRTFVEGFAVAAEQETAAEAAAQLSRIDSARRGFAFEGAAMALAIRDALPLGHNHHLSDFRAVADEHIYMIYVGAGWALARLPRRLHRAALRGLTDPVLIWLTLDGYGFHQTYFRTEQYVKRKHIDRTPPMVSTRHPSYAPRAIDQGIGRALWFVSGADPELARRLIEEFPEPRRADLYAGLGLAATYAGGATTDELRALCEAATEYRRCLGQGAVFAAEARARAGIVCPATRSTLQTITGLGVGTASEIAVATRPASPTIDGRVGFEVWRERIRRQCLTAAASTTQTGAES
ncbi:MULTISPECIES: DUF1702 family protein [unclassified Nocardia]|uniref:DUF1702 family protein n=1 Tax=unclassified Nocardia TaxID=2637762 RepID=UPI001CE3FB5D|nr:MULTISPECIES: DUF1702 family protein [unclassified Nocardia]